MSKALLKSKRVQILKVSTTFRGILNALDHCPPRSILPWAPQNLSVALTWGMGSIYIKNTQLKIGLGAFDREVKESGFAR